MKDIKFYLIAFALFGAVITVAIIAARMPSPQKNELSQQKAIYAQAEADLATAQAEMETVKTACQVEYDRWAASAVSAEARMIEAKKTADAIRYELAAKGVQLPLSTAAPQVAATEDFPQAEK